MLVNYENFFYLLYAHNVMIKFSFSISKLVMYYLNNLANNMAYSNFVVCMDVERIGFIVLLYVVCILHTCSVLPLGGDMGDFTKRSEVRTGGMGKLQKMV